MLCLNAVSDSGHDCTSCANSHDSGLAEAGTADADGFVCKVTRSPGAGRERWFTELVVTASVSEEMWALRTHHKP